MSDDTLLIILGNQLFDKKYLSKAKGANPATSVVSMVMSVVVVVVLDSVAVDSVVGDFVEVDFGGASNTV